MNGRVRPSQTLSSRPVIIIQVLAFGFVIAVTGCTDSDNGPCCSGSDGPGGTAIYFNSFESPSDTLGWSTYGTVMLADDAAPGGGSRSIHVSGGCTDHSPTLRLGPITDGGHFALRCWAKRRGYVTQPVVMTIAEELDQGMIRIDVTTSEWRAYLPNETLFCPPNRSLLISLAAFGFAGGTLQVDLLEVLQLEQ